MMPDPVPDFPSYMERKKEKDEPIAQTPRMPEPLMGQRMDARTAIISRIERLRREADALEQLSIALPLRLPNEADEALWQLVIGCRS